MPRVVVDPGVLVAALLSRRGVPRQLLLRWLAGEFDLLVSSAALTELDRVLAREKFRRYVSERQAKRFVATVRKHAVVVDDPSDVEAGVTRDPNDDYLVALARAGRADLLVSGDAHITDVPGLVPPVLTPRTFLDLLDRA